MWTPAENGRLDDLSTLAQFGHDMTTVMYRRTSGDFPARRATAVDAARPSPRPFGRIIEQLVDKAVDNTTPLFTMLNMTVAGVRVGPPPAGREDGTASRLPHRLRAPSGSAEATSYMLALRPPTDRRLTARDVFVRR